jgi:hypothetical protein
MEATIMKIAVKTLKMVLFSAVLLLGTELVLTGNALALERGGYSMEILIGGTPLCEYPARRTSYIEALKHGEYSVRLRNRTAERIAIALSVDGLNSIDARTTTARDARKWVLGPYETITIDGWQVSSTTARKFFFTTEERSYGNWLGKTNNLGLIAAAVFREKRRPISLYGEPPHDVPFRQREEGKRSGDESNPPARPEPSAPIGQAEGTLAPETDENLRGSTLQERSDVQPKKSDDLAATGIGEETSHPVQQVFFDSEEVPAAILELRYEYRNSLVRLGVLPAFDPYGESLSRRERARGFQESGFAPDPFRHRD